ncbi:hypothetical protein FB45DRAFT_1034752 [Roridomyces roridus]|uniref:FAD-binding domain-containing protein n=1 Tax=Roridomyces roridus TaxID=1738132 RepID=A0AAD7FCU2_9AGAR|nr:hypothetical protein FB45DRAFT_1034752 [Roridomyces roridus]
MTRETPLRFIIVGASIGGLASAIALRDAGHEVLLLEQESQLGGGDSVPSGGVRLPPNGCKILFDWGLEAEIRSNAVVGSGFTVYKYDGGGKRDYLGTNRWDPELLAEARGLFLQMRHKDLLRILYDTAVKRPSTSKVSVEFGVTVVDADFDACSVTLASGKVYAGDALIGADGAFGYLRRRMNQEQGSPGEDQLRGLAVYSAIVPKEVAMQDDQLQELYQDPQRRMVTFWMGPNRGAQAFLAGKDEDVVFWVYTPDGAQDGTWTQSAEKKITDVLGTCDPVIRRLAELAGPATCVQIKNYLELESWVSRSGKVLLLGEAAHPFPIISLHTYSVALEDGGFLGKMFSHTRNPDRVEEFLSAFQEHRKPRCAHINLSEKSYVEAMALPDGEAQEGRDAAMRANEAAGRNVMDSGDHSEEELSAMWDDMRMVFGYDPADDAEEWWLKWGRLRDAPTALDAKAMRYSYIQDLRA